MSIMIMQPGMWSALEMLCLGYLRTNSFFYLCLIIDTNGILKMYSQPRDLVIWFSYIHAQVGFDAILFANIESL